MSCAFHVVKQVKILPITSGMAAANIQMTFRYLGADVHMYTITRTLEHYSGVADEHIRTVKPPCVGDK